MSKRTIFDMGKNAHLYNSVVPLMPDPPRVVVDVSESLTNYNKALETVMAYGWCMVDSKGRVYTPLELQNDPQEDVCPAYTTQTES